MPFVSHAASPGAGESTSTASTWAPTPAWPVRPDPRRPPVYNPPTARGAQAQRGGQDMAWRSGVAVVLVASSIALFGGLASAQEPAGPPPPAGGRGHAGPRDHELLPDI